MSWTDERVELLKKLWEEGVSASQIATQLGNVSRNAVIGKVHRLKISRPSKSAHETLIEEDQSALDADAHDPPLKEADLSNRMHKTHAMGTERGRRKNLSTPAAPANPAGCVTKGLDGQDQEITAKRDPLKDSQATVAETLKAESESGEAMVDDHETNDGVVVPISKRLSLLQLTENTCKWPIGDPLGAGFYFCGAKTSEGSPYCSYHSKIAFQPIAERRRVKV